MEFKFSIFAAKTLLISVGQCFGKHVIAFLAFGTKHFAHFQKKENVSGSPTSALVKMIQVTALWTAIS
ncbi:hypothetical protein C8P68_107187 [Mucilaginibacter yixingensis]|uniref:Uncharacterized protein n=1 Tax=Mucilaginibacter yixingensis TaxID=1295612 RepID=A0A2T5J6F3_9SPHI|nr:hypothetical protein [Mucilaginibacter yixingensis]PTQ94122.1 hypothetical protein C8P68_107187 [Mucilaginibacter yixingensis]